MNRKLQLEFATIGADPEFLLNDGIKFVPSYLYFDGTKAFPEPCGEPGFAILKDNLLVEGNIPPCGSKYEFVETMKKLKSLIQSRLPKNINLVCDDLGEFDDEYVYTEDGQLFGCSNYIDVYDEILVPSPQLIGNQRPVGSHIHIGYDISTNTKNYTKFDIDITLGKALDYFIGIPSDEIKKCIERRNTYGKFGSIRQTVYGLEYRSLGGYFANDKYLAWQYDQVQKAIEYCSDIDNFEKLSIITEADEKYYDYLEIDLEAQVPEMELVTN